MHPRNVYEIPKRSFTAPYSPPPRAPLSVSARCLRNSIHSFNR